MAASQSPGPPTPQQQQQQQPNQGPSDVRICLRLLAEVHTLEADAAGAPHWRLVDPAEALLPVMVARSQVPGEAPAYHLFVGTSNAQLLSRPLMTAGVTLRKVEETFVQWRNKHTKDRIGLNFVSEADALKFMEHVSRALFDVKAWCKAHGRPTASSGSSTPSPHPSPRGPAENGDATSSITRKWRPQSARFAAANAAARRSMSLAGDASIDVLRSPMSHGLGQMDSEETRMKREQFRRGSRGSGVGLVKSPLSSSSSLGTAVDFPRASSSESTPSISQTSDDFDDILTSVGSHEGMELEADVQVQARQSLQPGGAVRRTGWVVSKQVLTRTKQCKISAVRRSWTKHWAILRGPMLLFYSSGDIDESTEPSHLISVEKCLVQPVFSNAKRENMFAIACASGALYHFEVTSAEDMTAWVRDLHVAAAINTAQSTDKDKCLQFFQHRLKTLREQVKSESDEKRMLSLQLDAGGKTGKGWGRDQISKWEKSLEALQIEWFRLDCYRTAISDEAQTNPQQVLAVVSKTTKEKLLRVGGISPMTLYLVVRAREALVAHDLVHAKQKSAGDGGEKKASSVIAPLGRRLSSGASSLRERMGSVSLRKKQSRGMPSFEPPEEQRATTTTLGRPHAQDLNTLGDRRMGELGDFVRVHVFAEGSTVIPRTPHMTALHVVKAVCSKRRSNPREFYLESCVGGQWQPLNELEVITPAHEQLTMKTKHTHEVAVQRSPDETFGFSIGARPYSQDLDGGDLPAAILQVLKVNPGTVAELNGLKPGDEILSVDAAPFQASQVAQVKALLRESTRATLVVRSLHHFSLDPSLKKQMDGYIRAYMPPSLYTGGGMSAAQSSDLDILSLVVPPPPDFESTAPGAQSDEQPPIGDADVLDLLRQAEELNQWVTAESEETRKLSKLGNVVKEIYVTERGYVRDLLTMKNRYLDHLLVDSQLGPRFRDVLLGNLPQLLTFQKTFSDSLETILDHNGGSFQHLKPEIAGQIADILFAAQHRFKIYSNYCANYSIAAKLLADENKVLQAFLQARNPTSEHATSLQSLLIKPVQRVLKYSPLLKELRRSLGSTPPPAIAARVDKAMLAMERVSQYINEMTRLNEALGDTIRDHVPGFYLSLHMSELRYHGQVEWHNAPDDKGGRSLEQKAYLLIFRRSVILCQRVPVEKRRGSRTAIVVTEWKFVVEIKPGTLDFMDKSSDDPSTWVLVDTAEAAVSREKTWYVLRSQNADERAVAIAAIQAVLRNAPPQRISSCSEGEV